jgi:hypothetical protein
MRGTMAIAYSSRFDGGLAIVAADAVGFSGTLLLVDRILGAVSLSLSNKLRLLLLLLPT